MPLISLTNFVILSYKARLSRCIRLVLLSKNVPHFAPGNCSKANISDTLLEPSLLLDFRILVLVNTQLCTERVSSYFFQQFGHYQSSDNFPVEGSLDNRYVLRWT